MLDNYVENSIRRSQVEHDEKWSDIMKEIPPINFDKEWDILVIPPFGGAVARFIVMKDYVRVASVYLDWYEHLGIYGEPYYELHPWEDDIKRYSLKETIELVEDIRKLYKEKK